MQTLSKEKKWLLEEKYNGWLNGSFYNDCERLDFGEPVAYVIGFVNFLNCLIDLSCRPLIPREETAYWVEDIIKIMKKENRKLHVLDIFSGSGCIGIAILKHVPEASVTFVDSEDDCLKQIDINLKKNVISPERYMIISSDMFKNVSGTFDYILANPPYVALARKKWVERSVLDYEPGAALWGGEDGLDLSRIFLKNAHKYLNPKGFLAMEFDDFQKDILQKMMNNALYSKVTFNTDQYGFPRWLTACRP